MFQKATSFYAAHTFNSLEVRRNGTNVARHIDGPGRDDLSAHCDSQRRSAMSTVDFAIVRTINGLRTVEIVIANRAERCDSVCVHHTLHIILCD